MSLPLTLSTQHTPSCWFPKADLSGKSVTGSIVWTVYNKRNQRTDDVGVVPR